jgi:protein N-terminal methyltransferase
MSKAGKQRPDSLISRDDGRRFWQGRDADENAMVVGFAGVSPSISKTDLQGSRSFLTKLGIGTGPGLRTIASALEGGAGYV